MSGRGKYRNLILIGNGFDRWQELPTSYESFRQYYYSNINRVLRKTHVKSIVSADGKSQLSPVELIYGNAFKPEKLSDDFFWNFENSTALIDDQLLNLYFGKTDKDLYQEQETIETAIDVLQEIFGEWIQSIKIDEKDGGYRFSDDCYFINFNYTDTLEKRFGVNEAVDYHIHGEADDPDSIIFGHATHPEMPFSELMLQKFIHMPDGGISYRLRGLYITESALYATDKNAQDNIDDLCEFMTLDGVHIEDIDNIYVLGMSFGDPDYEYFDFLNKATKKNTDLNELSAIWQLKQLHLENLDEDALLDLIQKNIIYAEKHIERALHKEEIPLAEARAIDERMRRAGVQRLEDQFIDEELYDAVRKRFLMEQAGRTHDVMQELLVLKGDNHEQPVEEDCYSVLKLADCLDGGHEPRLANAHWHISYFSDQDRDRITSVMQRIGCDSADYTLYPSIDECIISFKK